MIFLGIVCALLWFRVLSTQAKYEDPHPLTWSLAATSALAFFSLLIWRNWSDIKSVIIFLTAF